LYVNKNSPYIFITDTKALFEFKICAYKLQNSLK